MLKRRGGNVPGCQDDHVPDVLHLYPDVLHLYKEIIVLSIVITVGLPEAALLI